MKLASLTLIILFCNSLLQYFIPYWWFLAIICFVACFIWARSQSHAFFSALLGIMLSYLAMMLIQDYPANYVIGNKMSAVFSLPVPWGFYIITLLVGALTGGLSGISGFVGKNFFRSTKSQA